jgi:hypothetical protein
MKEERKQIVQPDYGEVANVVRSIFERMTCKDRQQKQNRKMRDVWNKSK